jgi:hypothetical protein
MSKIIEQFLEKSRDSLELTNLRRSILKEGK